MLFYLVSILLEIKINIKKIIYDKSSTLCHLIKACVWKENIDVFTHSSNFFFKTRDMRTVENYNLTNKPGRLDFYHRRICYPSGDYRRDNSVISYEERMKNLLDSFNFSLEKKIQWINICNYTGDFEDYFYHLNLVIKDVESVTFRKDKSLAHNLSLLVQVILNPERYKPGKTIIINCCIKKPVDKDRTSGFIFHNSMDIFTRILEENKVMYKIIFFSKWDYSDIPGSRDIINFYQVK
jgi:hypothetical protein